MGKSCLKRPSVNKVDRLELNVVYRNEHHFQGLGYDIYVKLFYETWKTKTLPLFDPFRIYCNKTVIVCPLSFCINSEEWENQGGE